MGDDACGSKIAFFGALTGSSAALGINENNGVKLAVDKYNKENADCKVELAELDSQGSPDQAPGLAQKAIDDTKILGIVGPAFSGESEAAGPLFNEAGLVDHHPVRDPAEPRRRRAGRPSSGRSATTSARARRPATTSRTC